MKMPFFGKSDLSKVQGRIMYSITPQGQQAVEDYKITGTPADILAAMFDGPRSLRDLMDRTHQPEGTVRGVLLDLQAYGYAVKTGGGATGRGFPGGAGHPV